jgi:hypothetical protein
MKTSALVSCKWLLETGMVMAFAVGLGTAGCLSSTTPPSGAGGIPASGGRASGGDASGGNAAGGNAGSGGAPTGGARGSGGAPPSGGSSSGGSSTIKDAALDTPVSADTLTQDDLRTQAPRPDLAPDSCGAWAATEGVCCAQYCSNDNKSENCDKCGGSGSAQCQVVNAKACTSGQWPEVHAVSDSEPWHYSRSTHFGTAPTGACAFGLYGLCSTAMKFTDPAMQTKCDTFCKAYPDLCKDPSGVSLRGNFAAPQGNYYTQFWSSLPGNMDNYLSCGECFELERTQNDGSEYQSTASAYTPPIVLQVADSCPCSANSKWCCGSGRDHCGEVEGTFQYGCQLPPAPPSPPADHDPLPNESMHFDLSDIAMARLQTANPNGNISDGVIPTKYKRVPCPVVGNLYIWMRPNAGPYYFSLTVVNMAGLGAAAKVEAQLPTGEWVGLERDKNYSLSRPQERYGTWALPQGYGPFSLPLTLRVADGSGRYVTAQDVVKTWAPSDSSQNENWFIDMGVQF